MITGTITAKPQAFAAAVKWAAGYLDARPAIPVWAGLLLDADGSTLTVTSMNENVSAVATLPVEGDGKGRAVVSGRLLKELVATFGDKPVEISGIDGAQAVSLASGRWRGTLPTFADEDYPEVPAPPEVVGTVGGDEFARVIAEVVAATSKDAERAAQWRSVHLSIGENEITAIGTDSYAAAGSSAGFVHTAEEPAVGAGVLVLAQPMNDAAAGFAGPGEIQVGLSESQLSLASPTRSVVMRVINGAEYNAAMIRKLIDQEQPAHATVKVADLQRPMKRAALVREKDGPISVSFAPGFITLAASSEELRRDGAEEIEAEYDGGEVTLLLNPKYFGDALAAAPGDVVDIALNPSIPDGGRPAPVVLTVKGSPWRHVLMPIKPMGR